MPLTSTEISRLQIIHPDEFHDGGDVAPGVLHSKIATIFSKIGDNLGSRFFSQAGLADTNSIDLVHNFKCAFVELSAVLYARDTGTGELTRLDESSSPKRSNFSVVATSGSLTTSLRVTNNSGASQDIAVIVNHDGGESQKTISIANGQVAAASLVGLLFSSSLIKSAIIPFDIHRQTASANLDETGHIFISYDSVNSLWKIAVSSNIDNSGVVFSITAAGQIQYTSTNILGASYSGELRVGKISHINI